MTVSTIDRPLILGFAREGIATYHFLRKQLPQLRISVTDDHKSEELSPQAQEILKSDKNLEWVNLATTDLDSFTVIYKSAGYSPFTKWYRRLSPDVTVSSATTLFFEHCPGKIIGVTGTKGKSTTTAVIHHILKTAGYDARLGGNIGIPMLELLDGTETEQTWFVLELSSHQLWNLPHSPHISVVQPIVPEHMDYYPEFDEYVAAKKHIVSTQNENDLFLFNTGLENLIDTFKKATPAKKIGFGIDQRPNTMAYIKNNTIYTGYQPFFSMDDSPLVGAFNAQNMMPGILIGLELGISEETIRSALKTFTPLPHRLEPVGAVEGVTFYNDSLATTVEAATQAITAFSGKPIVLIAGGYERHQDHTLLAKTILDTSVVGLVLFPTTGERLLADIAALRPSAKILQNTKLVSSMKDAVAESAKLAQKGGVVLMSPAAPSFNMFKDYQDRGDQFRAEVAKLA